jgi:hypothetical protein
MRTRTGADGSPGLRPRRPRPGCGRRAWPGVEALAACSLFGPRWGVSLKAVTRPRPARGRRNSYWPSSGTGPWPSPDRNQTERPTVVRVASRDGEPVRVLTAQQGQEDSMKRRRHTPSRSSASSGRPTGCWPKAARCPRSPSTWRSRRRPTIAGRAQYSGLMADDAKRVWVHLSRRRHAHESARLPRRSTRGLRCDRAGLGAVECSCHQTRHNSALAP